MFLPEGGENGGNTFSQEILEKLLEILKKDLQDYPPFELEIRGAHLCTAKTEVAGRPNHLEF